MPAISPPTGAARGFSAAWSLPSKGTGGSSSGLKDAGRIRCWWGGSIPTGGRRRIADRATGLLALSQDFPQTIARDRRCGLVEIARADPLGSGAEERGRLFDTDGHHVG